MSDDGIEGTVRRVARRAGRGYARAKNAYRDGRDETAPDGGARIVCRRHAERRTVAVDERGRPDCFDADHVDCRGCAEDVRRGRIETW